MSKLTNCKTCKKDVAKSAKVCPHCGAKNKQSIGCGTAIVVIILVVIIFSSYNKSNTTPAEKAREKRIEAAEKRAREQREAERNKFGSLGEAYIMTQNFIKKRLKAPSTAKFGYNGSISNVATHLGNGLWRVSGYVDSQNSFGAMLRSNYTANLQYNNKNDMWILKSLKMK